MGDMVHLGWEKFLRMSEEEFWDFMVNSGGPDPMENAVRNEEKYFLYRKAIAKLRKYGEKWKVDFQNPLQEDIMHMVNLQVEDGYRMEGQELKDFLEIAGYFDKMIIERSSFVDEDDINIDFFMHDVYVEQ